MTWPIKGRVCFAAASAAKQRAYEARLGRAGRLLGRHGVHVTARITDVHPKTIERYRRVLRRRELAA